MRRRRFMRCDRGLRKSILVAFSGGYPVGAAMAGTGYGESDRESQALGSSGPGASPLPQSTRLAAPAQTFPDRDRSLDKSCIAGRVDAVLKQKQNSSEN